MRYGLLVFVLLLVGCGYRGETILFAYNQRVDIDVTKNVIYLDGRIDWKAANVITSLDPKIYNEMWLDSGGGRVDAAISIANFVRKYKIKTHVDRKCHSACIIIFQSGTTRTAKAAASFIFHSSRYADITKKNYGEICNPCTRYMIVYLKAVGISARFFDRWPWDGTDLKIDAAEAMKYNIVQRIVN